MITLRPDQQAVKDAVYAGWSSGCSNMMAVMPTGSGKSILTTDIIQDGHRQGMTEIVMAHRNELVGQMSVHVARRGIKHRIIGSKTTIAGVIQEHRAEFGRSFVNPDAKCAVGSVQTIVARATELKQWAAQVDRWTLDEAHHGLEKPTPNIWGKAIRMFTNARGLGVTACPSRADGMGLGSHADGVFDDMVIGQPMRWLIDHGSLSDYEIACPESDLAGLIDDADFAASGDLNPKKGRLASQQSHIVGDVVEEYQRRAMGRRAICFATDVETANDMAARFNACGIPSASVSAKTDAMVRRDMIRRFKDGRIWVLVNVDLFDEGFDLPACDVVIMARPTGSLNKYLQMCGRAMRIDPANPAKVALIIDHVSNWKRHGLPDKPRTWTLDRRDKRAKKAPDPDDIPLTSCRECSRPYERVLPACPYCGAEPPLPDPRARTIEQVDGDLMLLDRAKLAEMRAAMILEAPADMETRVAMAAGPVAGAGARNRQMAKIGAQTRLREAIEQWAGIRRHMGETDQMIHRRFWHATGMDVMSALAADRDRGDFEAMSQTVEGWYNG